MRACIVKLQRISNTTSVAPLSKDIKRNLITLFNQSGNFLSSSEIPEAINATLTRSNPDFPQHLTKVSFEKEGNTSNSKPLAKSVSSYVTEDIPRGQIRDEFDAAVQWPMPGIENLSEREKIVRDALYGTDSSNAPGLEIVEEAERQLEEEK
ncbi:hypothetical protein J056_000302 [Wallemia ichthyophaga EXF-994]|uniref:Uncharacterized protein n=1 Tax=Wallemia ichthyophaga (strain EXF-994 / CBS 113033) TaxID=1299270 RepID=R9ARX1_WALI9|nr:uncharacterized protein J056_000302 [Wallemia ichthyophaga EXF-994]EOR04943.1 hypothetical protein J056_000302 [Wallemia ichthyophaga EXF-994]